MKVKRATFQQHLRGEDSAIFVLLGQGIKGVQNIHKEGGVVIILPSSTPTSTRTSSCVETNINLVKSSTHPPGLV